MRNSLKRILVADSGSTKTAWCMADVSHEGIVGQRRFRTQGLNPFQQAPDAMVRILTEEVGSLLADGTLMETGTPIGEVFFYGAGCTPEKAPDVAAALRTALAPEARIQVGSDMLGAAKAMAQDRQAVVCILGTGANSCLYDGGRIVANVPPLGYVLGDEGSGAYIGKRLVADCLKGQFSKATSDLFFAETQLTPAAVIQKTYREPMPNRFLASLSPFCARHRELPEIRDFLDDCFAQFVRRNVALYGRSELPVHFVGSIAWHYREEVTRAVERAGFRMGDVCQAPLERLAAYHAETAWE